MEQTPTFSKNLRKFKIHFNLLNCLYCHVCKLQNLSILSIFIVELLLDAGAHIEADEINCYGGKPLHWASEHEPATVELPLEGGADVNALNVKTDSDFYGFTPLIMNASQSNDCAEVTELLLEAGASIDARDARGKSALTHAIEGGLERIPEVLRRYGAKDEGHSS